MPKNTKINLDITTNAIAVVAAILLLVLNIVGVQLNNNKSKASSPSAITGDPTNVTPTSADLNGTTSSDPNGPAVTARGFQWGTDTNYGNNINDTNPQYVMALNNTFTEYGDFGVPSKCYNACKVATDNLGNIYTASGLPGEGSVFVQKYNSTGQYLSSFTQSRPGPDPGNIAAVGGIAIDSSYNIYLFGTEGAFQDRVIKKYDNSGNYLASIGSQGSGPGQFQERGALAIDSSNNIYAVDPFLDRVSKFNSAGVFQYSFGSTGSGPGEFQEPWGITVKNNGDIYITDSSLNRLQIFNNSGVLLNTFGTTGSGPGEFNTMGGVALDSLGNTYITDIGNSRAQKFDASLNWEGYFNMGEAPYYIASYGIEIIVSNTSGKTQIFDQGNSFADGSFSASLTGLTCGVEYHYRTFATNADGTSYGDDKTFSFDCGSVTTNSATNISTNSSTLNGNIVSSPTNITARGFEYGTSPSYGSSVSESGGALGAGDYNLNANGLECNTTYYFRAYITNSYGTIFGSQSSFTTADCSQMQVTTVNTPGLNPLIQPGIVGFFGDVTGSESNITQIGFQWGTSTSYGNTTLATGSTSPVTFINQFGSYGNAPSQFASPEGVATDSENNIYVADYDNDRIQKFTSGGVYQLSFGSFGGGNGELNGPWKLAVDENDYVYVVDSGNNRVQKFSKFGVYQSQFGSFGSGDGQFNTPYGIAIDSSNNILVTDGSNSRVQKFDSSGNYVSQFGSFGSGDGQFDNPSGISIDGSGNIYVADRTNNRVQKFDSSGNYLSQFGSFGSGDGQFNNPAGLEFNTTSNQLFVADTNNNRVQAFDASGNFVYKFGENGSNSGQFNTPYDVTTNSGGNILVADSYNNRIQTFLNTSSIAQGGFTGSVSGLTCGTTYHYRAFATNALGNAYGDDVSFVACANISTLPPSSIKNNGANLNGTLNGTGSFISAQGFQWGTSTSYGNTINNAPNNDVFYNYTSQFGSAGSDDGQFTNPTQIAKDSSDNIYVVDSGNNRVQKFDNNGNYLSQFGSGGSGDGQFAMPFGIVIDSINNIYVADSGNSRIQKFNSSGGYVGEFGSAGSGDGQFSFPTSMSLDSSGNIYVADTGNNRIQIFNNSGNYLSQFGSFGSGDGQFDGAVAVEVSVLNRIFVSDQSNNRVQVFNMDGTYQGQVNGINSPTGLDSDSQGNIYVASGGSNNVQLYDPSGNLIQEYGSPGSGDGEFNFPASVKLDGNGNIFVSEYFGDRIQKFSLTPVFKLGSFSASLSGLSCDVTYHYRAFITNEEGTFYGQDQTLTACLTMSTNQASSVSNSAGTLNGSVASTNNTIVRRGFEYGTSPSFGSSSFNTSGSYSTNYSIEFGSLGVGDGQFNYLQSALGSTIDSDGNIYVVDAGNYRIQKFDNNGNYLSQFGSYGSGDGQFISPTDIAINPDGNLFVIDPANNRIQVFSPNGDYLNQFPTGAPGITLDIDKNNFAYVVGVPGSPFVVKVNLTSGEVLPIGSQGTGPGQWFSPIATATDSQGNIYVSDLGSPGEFFLSNPYAKVIKYDSNGNFIKNIGSGGTAQGQFITPYGIAIDGFDNLYVSDGFSSNIQQFDTNGNYIDAIGIQGLSIFALPIFNFSQSDINGQFFFPTFITAKNDQLVISDSGNSRIQKFTVQPNFSPGDYSLNLQNLSCGQEYFYRAVGTNQAGQNFYGTTQSFKTSDCNPTPPTPAPTPGPTPAGPTEPTDNPTPSTPSEQAVQPAGDESVSAQPKPARRVPAIVAFTEQITERLLAVARSVPREVAIAIPYLLITVLLGFAVLYLIQSLREYRSSLRYNAVIKKYADLQLGAKNFISLTNHYLNTPVGIIALSAEGLMNAGVIDKSNFKIISKTTDDIKSAIKKLLNSNNKATNEILDSISKRVASAKPINTLLNPLLWVPVILSAILIVFANLLFIRAGVFGINGFNFAAQAILFVLFVILTLLSLKSFMRNKQTRKERKSMLNKEKQLIELKLKFIDEAILKLEKELSKLKEISSGFSDETRARSFFKGLEMLVGIETSFSLLKKFAIASPIETVNSSDIKRFTKKIIQQQKNIIKAKKLKTTVQIDKNIKVRLDKAGLIVLLGSIISNAVKFSSPHQEIIIKAEKSNNEVSIKVIDRGEIIPEEKIDILMTPFSRATDALKYDYDGIGLGLYMDRIILQQAGGDIEIKSSRLKGTIAKISLPLLRQQ
jgi:DNA-binding beta-propeller fold protein YncE/signal transduction histidine kinase